MEINTLANRCGYFFNANFEPEAKATPNNGYNCRHPEQSENYQGVGCCFSWSCPLGYEADEEDCESFGLECEESEFIIVDILPEEFNENCMWRREGGGDA
jgi:hypothetical protein